MSMDFTAVMTQTVLSEIERRRAAAGVAVRPMDEETFRAFYDRTSRSLWAYLARLTGDRHLADDLLQDAYYKFIRLGDVHESELHRRNSLFCIATNLARDVSRRRRHVQHVPLPEEHEPQMQQLRSTEKLADRVEGKMDLAKAMATLKPLQREMLWLAYAQGSSHVEIAEILGVKAASVKILLFRARKKLADILRGTNVAKAGTQS